MLCQIIPATVWYCSKCISVVLSSLSKLASIPVRFSKRFAISISFISITVEIFSQHNQNLYCRYFLPLLITSWLPDIREFFFNLKTFSGMRRSNPHHETRKPITLHILTPIVQTFPGICHPYYESTPFTTIFKIFKIVLQHSKTDQEGREKLLTQVYT